MRVAHSDIGYLYRYETSWVQDWRGRFPVFQCWEYPIISKTPHTILIILGSGETKRIYKDNSRKWAWPAMDEARNHFVTRKRNQYDIVSMQLSDCDKVLRCIMEDWGRDTGDLPDRKTIFEVYEKELESQRLDDRGLDLLRV
ncbi:hypothetical protein EVC27_046 [Rhizobium phage RHph_I1_6]|uniref:Uncharacterized protein n=1 Tax=Rhizobium phage RHph_I1_6 TaxID=2509728 RepID=A0A7S5RFG4_9CAUD|nr:hypothetical protein PP745_gp046 [Rhizobium phage RHph_I1_6]QIG76571.1 hypothetical protein EVC27_046 [Rhizobium phage RHph_I1_6]